MKRFFWQLVCAYLTCITTYKITTAFFYFGASTNDTTAPFAALITSIPVGIMTFHITRNFYRRLLKGFRLIIMDIVCFN